MDGTRLAQILHEEFKRDNWGDIDPWLFKMVSGTLEVDDTVDDDNAEDAEALREVLERVAKRINEETK